MPKQRTQQSSFKGLQRLRKRQRKGDFPLFGEIINERWKDEKAIAQDSMCVDESVREYMRNLVQKELCKGYAQTFDVPARPDYQLWVLLGPNSYTGEWRKHISATLIPLATDALAEAQNQTVVWGSLAVLGLQMGKRFPWVGATAEESAWAIEHKRHLLQLADLCHSHIDSTLTPLNDCKVACAVIRILVISGVEKIRYDVNGQPPEFQRANEIVDRLEAEFTFIYGDWKGGSLDWYATNCGPGYRDQKWLLPYYGKPLAYKLSDVLYRTRGLARSSLRGMTWCEDAAELLARVAPFSVTSWRTARGIRIGKGSGDDRSEYLDEVKKLRRAGQALRDAGDDLGAAALAHEWMWTTPDFAADGYQDIGDALAYWVKQTGLIADEERFPRDPGPSSCYLEPELKDDDDFTDDDRSSTSSNFADQVNSSARGTRVGRSKKPNQCPDPYRMRMTWDQTINPETKADWQNVLSACPLRSDPCYSPLGHFVYRALPPTPEFDDKPALLRSAFKLCLQYKQINNAAQLLERFPAERDELLSFTGAVGEALEVIPFGIHIGTFELWQRILRSGLSALPEDVMLSPLEWLEVHELLLGRCLSIISAASSTKIFTKKMYGLLSEEEVRSVYGLVRGVGANPRRLRRTSGFGNSSSPSLEFDFAETLGSTVLGQPVLVSLVRLSTLQWRVLVIAPNGDSQSFPFRPKSSFVKQARSLGEDEDLWKGVAWSDDFYELGRAVFDAVRSCDASARWIVLAAEPTMATIPWQDLMRNFDAGMVISLVPAFSWAQRVSKTGCRNVRGVELLISDEENLLAPYLDYFGPNSEELEVIRKTLVDTANQLREDSELLSQRFASAAVIYGHGELVPLADLLPNGQSTKSEGGRIASVVAPDAPIKLVSENGADWMQLAQHRILLVHACFGGRVNRQFLGDIGGLPGFALGVGCRLFCAPVAEVPPTVVEVLHRHLVSDGPTTFGERYLSAIKENEAVALYNLFGLACEPVQ